MKKYFLIILLITTVWTSCSEETLDVPNEGNFTADTFFSNASAIVEASTATYAAYQFKGLMNREFFFIFDLFGNDAEKNFPLQGTLLDFPGYTHSSTTVELNYFYTSLYQVIFRANFAIDVVGKWAPTLASDIAIGERVVGEVTFLKSLANFYLVTCFSDIPLKKTLSDHYETFQGRTPEAEVWTHIETSLLSAIEKLPDTYAAADYGRVTKGAAIALLGKVYLYQKKYSDAITQFSKLMAAPYNTIYDLAPSLDDIFVDDIKTKESVFQIIHGKWNGLVRGGRPEMSGGYYTHTRHAMEYGFADWWNVLVSDAAVAAFHYQDEASQPYLDPRAPLTYYDNLGNKGGDMTYCDDCPTGPKSYAAKVGIAKEIISFRKHELYESREKYGNPDSWLNTQVIRYADVLLMLAECYIETNQNALALPLINRVRARSGAFQYTTLGDKTKATTILRRERQIELFGEQLRYPDLVRWGILEETINDEKEAFNGTRPVKSFHVLFPFPQDERDANPVLNAQIKNNWN